MNVTDYPKLTEVLQDSRTITYLCGAGLSMSLGNHDKDWWHWLISGKDYLEEDDQSTFDSIISGGKMDDLIKAAGFLLAKLKATGRYDTFMKAEISSIVPSNIEVVAALLLINRAGDLLSTTNYDTCIEKAVGIGTVTYSDPGSIMRVIQKQSERKVIHLHGSYIPTYGIDDIIADEAQYADIIKNQGAQFIQQMIGINPLIIVGCGGTTEDPNMNGFLTFAAGYLKTDVSYFYLYKTGDDLTRLPENFIPVCYGNEYGDLPKFLHELVAYRIRYNTDIAEAIKINPYAEIDRDSSAYGRMHFLNRFNRFIGRDRELKQLQVFYNSPDRFSWWLVLGEGAFW